MTETDHPSPSSRMLWLLGGGVVAAAVAYVGLWLMLAVGLRDLALEWIDDQRRQGWSIALDGPRLSGFPNWPAVNLTGVTVTAPMEDGGWSWRPETLTLSPSTFDLTRLILNAPGTHLISSPINTNGVWTIDAANLEFALDLDTSGKWQGADLLTRNIEVRDSFERPWIGAERFDGTLNLVDAPSSFDEVFATFSGAADTVRMGVRVGPFSRTLRAVRLEADLVGPVTPGRLSEALDAWRSGGGTLEVRRVLLDWPPLAIAGDGTLALDDRLQPIGAFSTRITGFNETLQSMESTGVIPRGQAASAQIILGLLANTPPDSDEPELKVPLSVQDQRLRVGPFELMDLPEVVWE